MLTKEQLTKGSFRNWKLQSLITKDYPETPQQELEEFINNAVFLENYGGFIPVELQLYANNQFEVVYQLDLGPISGKGNWEIDNNNLILHQDTGDVIHLLDVKITANSLSAAYEYLSSDKGIEQLTFVIDQT